ncbi:hypothetical protein NRB_07200 [Novosphingobium sp. 11B]
MNNIAIGQWRPLPDGNFLARTAESGVYCKFDTDEPLDSWVNPITGETREIWPFLGGPFEIELGPDGVIIRGAELDTKVLRMEVMNDMVFLPTAASMARPNPLTPERWPTQGAGKTIYWESLATYSARVADILNPDVVSAPAFCQYQNLTSWHPRLGMGNRPGRTYGKAHGTKFASLEAMPVQVLRGVEKQTPEILDYKNWPKPHLDLPEYMAKHKPG